MRLTKDQITAIRTGMNVSGELLVFPEKDKMLDFYQINERYDIAIIIGNMADEIGSRKL
jgi:hypothetical protein